MRIGLVWLLFNLAITFFYIPKIFHSKSLLNQHSTITTNTQQTLQDESIGSVQLIENTPYKISFYGFIDQAVSCLKIFPNDRILQSFSLKRPSPQNALFKIEIESTPLSDYKNSR